MNWKSSRWLCLDVETTGLKPPNDKIVELGAVSFQNGEVQKRTSWLINPGKPIPTNVSKIHGITDMMVMGAPSISDIAGDLMFMVRHHNVVMAYNWPFDESFLSAEVPGWSVDSRIVVDPLVVVRMETVGKYWRGRGRHKLENVAKRMGISFEGDAHRAVNDCEVACKILWELKEYLPDHGAFVTQFIESQRAKQDADYKSYVNRKNRVGNSGI